MINMLVGCSVLNIRPIIYELNSYWLSMSSLINGSFYNNWWNNNLWLFKWLSHYRVIDILFYFLTVPLFVRFRFLIIYFILFIVKLFHLTQKIECLIDMVFVVVFLVIRCCLCSIVNYFYCAYNHCYNSFNCLILRC